MPQGAPSSKSIAIRAESLTRRYGGRSVVDNFSVEIEKGQIFGLLGPNAAGKTTAIRMLCGIIDKDEGSISINASDIANAKRNIGYVSQKFGQYEELTVRENLQFYARMYDVTDERHLANLLERYALTPFADQKAGTLSGGYQRRLALVCATAHNPDVLFLDEPTAGIDPVTRKVLWDEFYQLSAQGKTLFVTTHYMEEAQRCHQLAFIDHGKMIAQGTPVTIKQSLGNVLVYTTQLSYHPQTHRALLANASVILVNQFGSELRIIVNDAAAVSPLEATIAKTSAVMVSLVPGELNLEDVFIALTQHREIDR